MSLSSFVTSTMSRLLLAFFIAVQPAAVALEWETTRVTHRAAPDEDALEGVFAFHNAGTERVTITSVSSSCGCTVPALEKRSYAPGEAGRIVAKFTFGDRTGRQVKTVNVTTDEPGARPTILTLEVEIPEWVQVRPRFVLWRRGELPASRALTVRIAAPAVDDVVTVEPPDQRFSAVVERTDEQGVYSILITPRDTETTTTATLRLSVRVGDSERRLSIVAAVR